MNLKLENLNFIRDTKQNSKALRGSCYNRLPETKSDTAQFTLQSIHTSEQYVYMYIILFYHILCYVTADMCGQYWCVGK